MKEELISFETAKLAKEVGFDCVTNKYYTPNSGKLVYGIRPVVVNIRIKAPTQSLLQRWLREKHKIHITIHYHKSGTYSTHIADEADNCMSTELFGEVFNTYEAALEAGLLEALKLIKT